MPLVSVQPIRQVADDLPASLPKIQCHKALFIESRQIAEDVSKKHHSYHKPCILSETFQKYHNTKIRHLALVP